MNINELPTLVLNHLFQYLNVNQRSVARQVCRQWAYEIDLIDRHCNCLFIHPKRLNYSFGKRWSYSNELIGHKHSLEQTNESDFTDFQFNFNCDRFKKIRKLNVSFPVRSHQISIEFINKFDQLEQLEINCAYLVSRRIRPEFELNLPKLQILSLKDIDYRTLVVDSPLLTSLVWYPCNRKNAYADEQSLRFVQPVYIEHLECEEWPIKQLSADSNLNFDRLETLICLRMKSVDSALLQLPIKQLQIAICSESVIDGLQVLKYDTKRFDLNMLFLNFQRYRSVEPDDESRYLTYFFINGKHLDDRLIELSRTTYIPYRVSLYYNGLAERFKTNAKCREFLTKLTKLYKVEVFNQNQNQRDLIEFLRHCQYFQHLELYNTSFDETFFEQLAQFKSINFLEIKEDTFWFIKDYAFMGKLVNLKILSVYYDGLSIDYQHILDFVEQAFTNSTSLGRFIFGNDFLKVRIYRSTVGYLLRVFSNDHVEIPITYDHLNIDQLMSTLKQIKDEFSVQPFVA